MAFKTVLAHASCVFDIGYFGEISAISEEARQSTGTRIRAIKSCIRTTLNLSLYCKY